MSLTALEIFFHMTSETENKECGKRECGKKAERAEMEVFKQAK